MSYSFLHVAEKGAVIGKQQLCDEFLNGFCVCEETPKAEHCCCLFGNGCRCRLAGVLFRLTKHDAEEDGEQCGDQDAPCLTPLEMWKLPDSDPLCFISPDPHGAGEMVRNLGSQPRRARIFQSPSQLTVSNAFVKSLKAVYTLLSFPCISPDSVAAQRSCLSHTGFLACFPALSLGSACSTRHERRFGLQG